MPSFDGVLQVNLSSRDIELRTITYLALGMKSIPTVMSVKGFAIKSKVRVKSQSKIRSKSQSKITPNHKGCALPYVVLISVHARLVFGPVEE